MERNILYKTLTRNIIITQSNILLSTSLITSQSAFFNNLCQSGCRNYGQKYSCPPHSPKFTDFIRKAPPQALVICYKMPLSYYSELSVYNRIRAGNSILKSLIDKELMQYRQKGYLVAGSGSCRACRTCGLKTDEPCRKPHKRIYSLEALGVDVDALVKDSFGFPLQWYFKGRPEPEYTCTVGAVFVPPGFSDFIETPQTTSA